MTAKQSTGLYAPDGAKYATPTDGAGNLAVFSNVTDTGSDKTMGSQAPDGSIYFCLTTGDGNLI